VGRRIQKVDEAWGGGETAAGLLMDVKGAFPNIAKGNQIKKMVEMGFEADVCRWVESFMSDRRVAIRMEGRDGKVMDVTNGVSQGSPVSPILLVIYISELLEHVEE
jgi:hypothetical protein